MEKKKCSQCKNEYPKTEDYFFRKIIRNRLVNGDIVEYKSYRHICKKCHGKQGESRRIKKRCLEMGCEFKDYRDNWKKQYSRTRDLYPELSHLPQGTRHAVMRKIRKTGYEFTTYEQYKKDCSITISKAKRKYDYGSVEKVTTNMANKMSLEQMTDARIALIMGLPVNDVPKEIIEVKRTLIMLKREAGLTHSTK